MGPYSFFSQKMILLEKRYKTHNRGLLVIDEAYKSWKNSLKGFKHKVLGLTDYNNFC